MKQPGGRLTTIKRLSLTSSNMTSEEISQWFCDNLDMEYHRPVTNQAGSSFSFEICGTESLACWSGSVSARQQLEFASNEDTFDLFVEKGSSIDVIQGKTKHRLTPGSGLIASTSQLSGLNIAENASSEGFYIRKQVIAEAIVSLYERPMPSQFEFSPSIDCKVGTTQKILTLTHFFANYVCDTPSLNASPIALASFMEALAMLLLENVEHSLQRPPASAPLIAPSQVKKAKEFAIANIHLPITVTDMAEAAGVNVRALQYNFARFLGTTPSLYLRNLRLDSARIEIQNSPPTVTIAEIARRWGFTHMGRFSVEYKKSFGTSPSSELSKQRRR